MRLSILFFFLLSVMMNSVAVAQETHRVFVPITQMSLDGNFDVTLKEVKVSEGILTVVLLYQNTSKQSAKISYPIKEVYLIDNVQKKKHFVLQDEKKQWLAAPVCNDVLNNPASCYKESVEVPAQGRQAAWFKFAAPPVSPNQTVNLVIPEAIPFENIPVGP